MQPLTFNPGEDDTDARARLEAEGRPVIAGAQEFPEVLAELSRKGLVHPDMRHENNLGLSVYHPAGIRLSLVFNALEIPWEGLTRDEVHATVQEVLESPERIEQSGSRTLRNPAFHSAVKNELTTRLLIIEREVSFRVRVQRLVADTDPKIVGNTELLRAYKAQKPDAKALLYRIAQELVVEGKIRVYDLLRLTQ